MHNHAGVTAAACRLCRLWRGRLADDDFEAMAGTRHEFDGRAYTGVAGRHRVCTLPTDLLDLLASLPRTHLPRILPSGRVVVCVDDDAVYKE